MFRITLTLWTLKRSFLTNAARLYFCTTVFCKSRKLINENHNFINHCHLHNSMIRKQIYSPVCSGGADRIDTYPIWIYIQVIGSDRQWVLESQIL